MEQITEIFKNIMMSWARKEDLVQSVFVSS